MIKFTTDYKGHSGDSFNGKKSGMDAEEMFYKAFKAKFPNRMIEPSSEEENIKGCDFHFEKVDGGKAIIDVKNIGKHFSAKWIKVSVGSMDKNGGRNTNIPDIFNSIADFIAYRLEGDKILENKFIIVTVDDMRSLIKKDYGHLMDLGNFTDNYTEASQYKILHKRIRPTGYADFYLYIPVSDIIIDKKIPHKELDIIKTTNVLAGFLE